MFNLKMPTYKTVPTTLHALNRESSLQKNVKNRCGLIKKETDCLKKSNTKT